MAKAKKKAASRVSSANASHTDAAFPRDMALAAGTVFALLALVRLAAAQFPAARVWGLNAAAWLPTWMQFVLAAAGILAATPLLYRIFLLKGRMVEAMPVALSAVVFALIAGAVFWFARMHTYFLGDGAAYLAEHFRFVRGLPVSEDVLFSTGSAPLTAWPLAQAAKLLWESGGALAENPQTVFWISGAIAGTVYVFLVVLFSRRWSESGAERAAFIAILLFTPGVLFFFGYVEYYTFALVGMLATVFLSMESARGRLAPVWPLFALLVSAAFHLMSLVLLPGVLLAVLAKQEKFRMQLTLRNVLLLAAAALVLGGVYYFASGVAFHGSRIILALQPFGEEGAVQHYTLLSWAHLADIVNMLVLTGAPMLAVLPFLRRKGWDIPELVGLAHVIFAFFLMLFGYTCFGMARDWDVNAFFGVVLTLFILGLLRREEAPRRQYLLYLAALGSIVAVLPWLLVNLDSGRSEQRFRDVMALDDRNVTGDFALNGYEHLRKYYQSTDDRANVAWAIQKKIEMVGYPEDFRKYALAVIEGVPAAGRPARYAWIFEQLRERLRKLQVSGQESLYEGSRTQFRELTIELLLQLGQLPQSGGEVDALFQKEISSLRTLLGEDALLDMVKGQYGWDRNGRFPGAAVYRHAAGEVQESGTLAFYIGRGLLTAEDYIPAAASLEQALALDSGFTLPAYYLAEAEMRIDPPRIDQAITHYDLFLATPDRHRIANPATQQQLMNDARSKSATLEVRRLSIP
ncbi:MAG: hypothetical protein IH600_10765 [Bacteroidetes bacterium]|nr:hypothetical protein [Bacteroidota bacterium]